TGTDFAALVDDNDIPHLRVYDGAVALSNPFGNLDVLAGEEAIVPANQRPQLAAVQAQAIIQWWLYYPGVLDVDELALSAAEKEQLATSLTDYRRGALI